MTDFLEPSELELQRSIIDYLGLHRWLVAHVPNGGTDPKHRRRMAQAGAVAGWPDLVAVSPAGETVYIEVKTSKGRLSPDQMAVHSDLTERGARVEVVRNLDDVADLIFPFDE